MVMMMRMMMKRRRMVKRMERLMGTIRKPCAEICHLLFLGICMFMPSNAFGSYEYDSVWLMWLRLWSRLWLRLCLGCDCNDGDGDDSWFVTICWVFSTVVLSPCLPIDSCEWLRVTSIQAVVGEPFVGWESPIFFIELWTYWAQAWPSSTFWISTLLSSQFNGFDFHGRVPRIVHDLPTVSV